MAPTIVRHASNTHSGRVGATARKTAQELALAPPHAYRPPSPTSDKCTLVELAAALTYTHASKSSSRPISPFLSVAIRHGWTHSTWSTRAVRSSTTANNGATAILCLWGRTGVSYRNQCSSTSPACGFHRSFAQGLTRMSSKGCDAECKLPSKQIGRTDRCT